MNTILTEITSPIAHEMSLFNDIFADALSHTDGLLNEVLTHIRQRGGKRMRPILTLLIAKNLYQKQHGQLNNNGIETDDANANDPKQSLFYKTLLAACALELLHTASLVHDDVVDEADERRGQSSVNASYRNSIAVLVGDYILSASLDKIAETDVPRMTHVLAKLGMTLSEGEVKQQQNISTEYFSIDAYFDIISSKTASLFEACCSLGSISVSATETDIKKAIEFGKNIGVIFQIRDDIFDYYDSKEIGKPTGNDMREGKLTLPALYCLNNNAPEEIKQLAVKVKALEASADDIAKLIAYTKENGGIEHARKVMDDYYQQAISYVRENVIDADIANSLTKYVDYVIGRSF